MRKGTDISNAVFKQYPYLKDKCTCGHHPLGHYTQDTPPVPYKRSGCLIPGCKCKKSEEEAYAAPVPED